MTPRPPVGPVTPHLFRPDRQRPVRAKLLHLLAATRVVPHAHPWGQIAISSTGVVRVTMPHGTTIVPPSRALWIPPGVEHALTVVEDADLLTLYVDPGRRVQGLAANAAEAARWRHCRVLEASRLLLALALELDARPDDAPTRPDRDTLARERRIAALLIDELRRAPQVPLGIALPAEKRLRRLCESMLDDPSRHASLEAWAGDAGASARTIARPVPQRARHHLRPLARAGAARPRRAAGGAPHADGGDRRRARLRQPERVRRDGQALGRQLADALFPRRGLSRPRRDAARLRRRSIPAQRQRVHAIAQSVAWRWQAPGPGRRIAAVTSLPLPP